MFQNRKITCSPRGWVPSRMTFVSKISDRARSEAPSHGLGGGSDHRSLVPHRRHAPQAGVARWLALLAILSGGVLAIPESSAAANLGLTVSADPFGSGGRDLVPGTQDGKPADGSATTNETQTSSPSPELIAKLETYLTGATLKGRYTITGRDVPPADESYTIISAKKLPEGDLWRLEARIQYGQWDLTVPITVPIKWADQTPVISIDKLTIPAMGTFSARVLFNNGMYSGTWAHDEVKGQLFGQVIPATEYSKETKDKQDEEGAAAKPTVQPTRSSK